MILSFLLNPNEVQQKEDCANEVDPCYKQHCLESNVLNSAFFIFIRLQDWQHGRWNISISIPQNLSIPTEMGYIQPLVENENSAKLCYFNLC